ncbi:MAG: hypothetical protein K2K00_07575 [Muribaculaceae bacterium]|nr:hypothetical protein [Muribaculaceae bacterium]
MSKSIVVKRLEIPIVDVAAVSAALDRAEIPFHKIENVNWTDYPYCPEVRFRIAHTGDSLLLNYRVTEDAVRAAAQADNGPVWEDSCVEFFITFDGCRYQNVECNCVGTVLSAVGPDRGHREFLTQELLDGIKRHSSLNSVNLPSAGPVSWEVSLIIPVATYRAFGLKSFSGITARCNFYKCGDRLPTPHFLSWNPIGTPSPDFHCPEYFGEIRFE